MARRNPAWVEDALHGADLGRAPAQPKRRKRCDPERAASQNRSCYMELGVGGFGVVLSTDDPKTVVKLTTDRSEAQFAAASIAYDLRARGVVG